MAPCPPLLNTIVCLKVRFEKDISSYFTLTRPLRKKLRMRWFSDVSKVKESGFFKSDLTDSPHIFDAHLLENTY